jgi:tetratricopeptide (TPR) repeat protein
MKWMLWVAISAMLTGTASATAVDPDSAEQDQVSRASHLIQEQKPAEAVPLLDKVIAANDARHRKSTELIYCARTQVETLLYMAEAATAKRSAIAVDPTWCDAIHLKGYALVELGRPAEAREFSQRAVAMAPHNAYYRAELAESYKSDRNWDKAFALFKQAADDARYFSPEGSKTAELARALRGMGFVLSEKGQFDEAKKLFEECLRLDPKDGKAKSELQYIADQRARRGAS